tara:strand:+ start:811 stop:1242 length:432 start_codon:yes stop_codon:yes gene_type:complete
MNEFKKVRNQKFIESQNSYRDYVAEQAPKLFKALNVKLERTENTELIPNWETIAASIPGVLKDKYGIGYAETENINDTAEAFTRVVKMGYIIASTDGWVYPDMLHNNKYEIKLAFERNQKNNLTQLGRSLARFNYLLNEKVTA